MINLKKICNLNCIIKINKMISFKVAILFFKLNNIIRCY